MDINTLVGIYVLLSGFASITMRGYLKTGLAVAYTEEAWKQMKKEYGVEEK